MGSGDWGLGIGDWGLGPIPILVYKLIIKLNLYFDAQKKIYKIKL